MCMQFNVVAYWRENRNYLQLIQDYKRVPTVTHKDDEFRTDTTAKFVFQHAVLRFTTSSIVVLNLIYTHSNVFVKKIRQTTVITAMAAFSFPSFCSN